MSPWLLLLMGVVACIAAWRAFINEERQLAEHNAYLAVTAATALQGRFKSGYGS